MFDAADRYLGRYKFWPAVRLLLNRFCVSLLNRFKYVSGYQLRFPLPILLVPKSDAGIRGRSYTFFGQYVLVSRAYREGREGMIVIRKAFVTRARSRRDCRVAVAVAAQLTGHPILALPRYHRLSPLKAKPAATFTTLTLTRKTPI